MRRAFALGALALCLTAYAAYSWSTDPMTTDDRPQIEVAVRVLDPMHRYLYGNPLSGRSDATEADREADLRDAETTDSFVDYLVARAGDRFADDPGGIVLSYDAPRCPFTLPAGRQFKIKYTGGHVQEIEGIFPLEPVPWDAMQEGVTALIELLDSAGWLRSSGYFTPSQGLREVLRPEDFLKGSGPKWAAVGHWEHCGLPGVKAYLEVRHFNSASAGAFTPPVVLSQPLPEDAEDRFLFLIRIEAEYKSDVRAELEDLQNQRRFAQTGDASTAIPLSVWLDDPEWRPEGWDGAFLK